MYKEKVFFQVSHKQKIIGVQTHRHLNKQFWLLQVCNSYTYMSYLSKLILTTDCTTGYAKRALVPRCEAQNWWCCRTPYLPTVVVADTVCGPLCWWWDGVVGLAQWALLMWGGRAYVKCRSGVLKKTSVHIWDSWNFPMFLLRDRSLPLMNMASLMVLAMVCDSLPTMEKFSNLVWCPEVLAWS